MPLRRRFHKKSRHSCSQCKRNRTKCDEKRPPTCGRCKRIGSACSLTSQSPALTSIPFQQPTGGRIDNEAVLGEPSLASFSRPAGSSNTSSPPTTTFSSLSSSSPSSSNTTGSTARSDRMTAPEMQLLSALERDRLRLMNHYTLHTAKAMLEVTHPGHTDPSIWSNRVPELASQYDFLQYGLLSISALDMALHGVSRRKEHIFLATNHYGLAVAAVRPYLTNNHPGQNPDTVGALFAFQCFVIAYAFRIQVCTEQPARSPIETIHNILVLLHRSPHSVVFQHEGSSALTPWVSLYPPPPSDPDRKLPAEIDAALDAIRRRLSAAGLPTTHATMYTSALQTLRTALLIAIEYHNTHMTYGYFPTCVTSELWTEVHVGAPVALCVLANYMVILHWRSTCVWFGTLPRDVVHATRQILSAEWHPCLAWAISETERVGGNKGPAGLL